MHSPGTVAFTAVLKLIPSFAQTPVVVTCLKRPVVPPEVVTLIIVSTANVVGVFEILNGAAPRMMGAPASAELPPEPPHPARSSAAHAMTAPAAFALRERELNPLNRLRAAFIGRRASPGLNPIIVHVLVTIGHGGREEHRDFTVCSRDFMHYGVISCRCGPLSSAQGRFSSSDLERPLVDVVRLLSVAVLVAN